MCPSRGVVDVFIEPCLPKPQVILCGATPSQFAVAELAPRVGFRLPSMTASGFDA
jgi:xanthine dehydrogenase accessory factor